ncbi:MAG: DUF2520 domain-containing protein [Clostridium celatum]|nr:Rossmann-like and DUF2520 domain-containing protein [uncultured Clostridium sp.]MDU4884147.1 DUF2520 domain-containing protein [Clostridium celatum]MDU7077313.1 DUF2520 domain-containing protein [Clostridium celatum]
MIIIKFGFIGAGKVGFSLGKYLKENNIDISGYYSKSQHSSKEAAIFTNTRQYNNLEDLIKNSDTIFITTPDNKIADVWNEIKRLPIKEKLICHCSGSISSEVFSNINNHGAYGYSIHPMFAISDKYNSYKNLSQAFITIEGHEKHIKYLKRLFLHLGNDVTVINKDNKILYHAASVTVSNLVLGLINNSINYLEECGFTQEMAIKALYPLIENNLRNVKERGAVNSLTGPIERGDLSTVINHLNVIPEEDKELYRLLSKNILKIAKVKNLNRDYKNLEEYLGD